MGSGSGLESDATAAPVDATLPSSSGGGAVVVRAGGGAAYPALIGIEPRHYVVGAELARGGMGRIVRAFDRRLDRTVAIKELLRDDATTRVRFEREARITAKLQHPSIVSIHEAGTWPSGEPFFAMKLVDGKPLDRVVAGCATAAERLALLPVVIAAVDALAYAHARRVIHRDLKPANILVGDYGETVVIDWGLAKELRGDDAGEGGDAQGGGGDGDTVAGAVMGTPAYMPREQAEGVIVDERADVYALGAVLYHVLTGEAPFTGPTSQAILARVLAEPPPALAGTRGIPGDLAAIVDKAMAVAPAERFANAGALAADLKRFAAGQLVGAHVYSTRQLIARWLRKHRTAVAVAAIAIVVLATGSVVGVTRILDERRATAAERDRAERHRADAEGLVHYMLGDLADKLGPLGKLPLLADVARRAGTYYAATDAPRDAAERLARSDVDHRIGTVLATQGDRAGAERALGAAIAAREALVATQPGDAAIADAAAESHAERAWLLQAEGAHGSAGLADAQRCATLRAAIAHPTPAQRGGLATCRELVAMSATAGEVSDASVVAAFAEALAIREELARAAPDDRELAFALATTRYRVAISLRNHDLARSSAGLREAIAGFAALLARDPDDQGALAGSARAQSVLAEQLAGTGDRAAAIAMAREALAIHERLVARDPTNASWRYAVASDHRVLATQIQDPAERAREASAGAAVADALVRADASNENRILYAALLARWAQAQLEQDDLAGARAHAEASRAIRADLLARAPSATARAALSDSLDQLTKLALDTGDFTHALETARASLALAAQAAAEQPGVDAVQQGLGVGHLFVATIADRAGDRATAREHAEAGLAIGRALVAHQPKVLQFLVLVAGSAELVGKQAAAVHDTPAARAAFEEAIAAMRAMLVVDPTLVQFQARIADDDKQLAGLGRKP